MIHPTYSQNPLLNYPQAFKAHPMGINGQQRKLNSFNPTQPQFGNLPPEVNIIGIGVIVGLSILILRNAFKNKDDNDHFKGGSGSGGGKKLVPVKVNSNN